MGQLLSSSAAEDVSHTATVVVPNPAQQKRPMCRDCSDITGKTVYRLGHCCAHYLRSQGKNPLASEYSDFVGRYETGPAIAASLKTPGQCELYLAKKLATAERNKRSRDAQNARIDLLYSTLGHLR